MQVYEQNQVQNSSCVQYLHADFDLLMHFSIAVYLMDIN